MRPSEKTVGPTPGVWGAAILVIDDEAQVRQLVRRTLEPAGATVLDAASGAAGLELVSRSPRPLDLVITDVRMPGITGVEVAQVLSIFRPDLPVLAISGYVDAGAEDRRITVLPKPFAPEELIRAARALIDRGRALTPAARERRTAAKALRGMIEVDLVPTGGVAGQSSELIAAAQALRRLNQTRSTF
ncbi:MAG: response regulator [Gemmatimonadales bacterium]